MKNNVFAKRVARNNAMKLKSSELEGVCREPERESFIPPQNLEIVLAYE